MSKNKKPAIWDKYFLILAFLVTAVFLMGDFHFSFKSYQTFQGHQTEDSKGKKYTVLLVYPTNSLAETQQFMYSCMAARNLGWECYTLGFNELMINDKFLLSYISFVQQAINYFLEPDFIMYISPHMMPNRLDNIVKIGILDLMQTEVLQYRVKNTLVPETLNWTQNYDGFIVYGDSSDWYKPFLSELRKYYQVSNFVQDGFYPSTFGTSFQESPKDKLFYCGNNWDYKRKSEHYKDIYKLLDTKDYFEVYGVKKAWSFLNHAYKGLITINSLDFLDTMRSKGITLVLHSGYHLKYGIPSNRIFEASAMNNVIISDYNPFIIREFGDCVYFVDFDDGAAEVVNKIDQIVTITKSNPKLANEKAKCAHDIFINNFTLETQLIRVAKMYEEILQTRRVGLND